MFNEKTKDNYIISNTGGIFFKEPTWDINYSFNILFSKEKNTSISSQFNENTM